MSAAARFQELLQQGTAKINNVEVRAEDVSSSVLSLVPEDVCRKHRVIPLAFNKRRLLLAMADPSDFRAIDDVAFLTGLGVVPARLEGDARALHDELFGTEHRPDRASGAREGYDGQLTEAFLDEEFLDEEFAELPTEQTVDLGKAAEDSPIVKLVNLILVDAIKKGAADVLLERYETECRVRYSIDGVLHVVMKPPRRLASALVARLHTMCELPLGDGQAMIHLNIGMKRHMRYRLTARRTLFGETVHLRLCDVKALTRPPELEGLMAALAERRGLVLGTGEGLTHLMLEALSWLPAHWHLATLEGVVELPVRGINQRWSAGRPGELALLAQQRVDAVGIDTDRGFDAREVADLVHRGALVWLNLPARTIDDALARLDASLGPLVSAAVHKRLEPLPCQACSGQGCEACYDSGRAGRRARYEVREV